VENQSAVKENPTVRAWRCLLVAPPEQMEHALSSNPQTPFFSNRTNPIFFQGEGAAFWYMRQNAHV